MEFIMNNWYIIIAVSAALGVAVAAIIRFFKLPTEAQLDNVREWLLYAVTEAERELGSGTGQLKLRSVYDMFVLRFPSLVHIIPFDWFSELVDEALVEMREMLAKNQNVKKIVCPEPEQGNMVGKVGF